MKLTSEEIERGFQELGLIDAKTLEVLKTLSRMTQPKAQPRYETITVAHTLQQSQEHNHAELESNP